ncbi:unnamed protein product [Phytophthora fragariaefolia]|uniref:Unnamed protein product n=1 Tax=Phytophthora fragariaefolia TaxID=1490495 RepID=A0A9W6XVE3_9STRA|nr:unnamed protein product [Phytophthora fragariaefolia]
MKLFLFLAAASFAIYGTEARDKMSYQQTEHATKAGVINYKTVEPFPEPKPVTIAQKAAVKFKPSLLNERGCHSYAAVNAAGDTSGGLNPTATDKKCAGFAGV